MYLNINKVTFNGLEPGWLGVSFGLRNCYVRVIITRKRAYEGLLDSLYDRDIQIKI
jgi:hypothetical protein